VAVHFTFAFVPSPTHSIVLLLPLVPFFFARTTVNIISPSSGPAEGRGVDGAWLGGICRPLHGTSGGRVDCGDGGCYGPPRHYLRCKPHLGEPRRHLRRAGRDHLATIVGARQATRSQPRSQLHSRSVQLAFSLVLLFCHGFASRITPP
jgi:hypothetical protein